ncbi:sialidase family protein [Methylibium rhizosphaerae]|uniref:sialidase family protein n=1 Tax=Methylibium rhizosphaerae TaxID=2570323 RepID=UPI0015E2FE92|nr:sialidase family protein [Methylibium rhizosphaerae]
MPTATPAPTPTPTPTATPTPTPTATPTPTPAGGQAQTYRWGNVAIGGGGFVTAVIPSKTQRNLFYARTDVGGAYRWDAAAGRWVPLLDGLSEDDVGLMGVESMALDPKNPAVVYVLAGTSYFSNGKTAVMRSTDYGASFARITDVSAQFRVHGNGMGRGNGEKMQVDPGSSNVVYVGSRNNGLFKSTDSGASFSRVNALPVTGTPNEAGISFVLLDPSSVANGVAQRIFVGVSRYGSVGANLYRSNDAGATFSAVSNAPAGFIPQRAALASDGNLYITYATGSGPHGDSRSLNPPEPMDAGQVWKYSVAGGTWTNVTPAGITGAFSGVSVDPGNPQRVLVSTVNNWMQQGRGWGDHFFLSTNGGAAWTDVVARGFALDTNGVSWVGNNTIHWANGIEFDPFDSKAAWVTSGNGLFRTANLDAVPTTWTFAVKGLEETVPLGLVSVPGGPLLSVIGDYDGYRHTDVNAYAPIHTPSIGTTTGLAVAAANTSVVVRVGREKLYRSADTGVSWTQVPVAPVSSITESVVALSADGSTLLHTMTAGGAVATYRSGNFANPAPTWSAVSGLNGRAVRPVGDPVRAARFYAYDSGNGQVLTSNDGGASFAVSATVAAGGSTRLSVAPGREGDVWIPLRDGGLVRSTNSGAAFSRLSNVSSCSAVGFGKAAAGSSYPTVFIWGAAGGGKRGLYRSVDAGANWTRINDDAHQFGGPGNGQFVVGDMNTEGMVYMSTVGRGIVYGAPATAP